MYKNGVFDHNVREKCKSTCTGIKLTQALYRSVRQRNTSKSVFLVNYQLNASNSVKYEVVSYEII